MKMNRAVLCLSLMAVILAGCSGGDSSTPQMSATSSAPAAAEAAPQYMAKEYEYGEYSTYASDTLMDEAYYDDAGEPAVNDASRQQKIILEANLNMATDRFDEVAAQIRGTAVSNDGYVENSSQSSRYDGVRVLNITIRVPSERYEATLTRIKNLCVLREAGENQRNATAEYYDIQARLETKLIEEERLLELISRTENVEDILKLEELLGTARTQIEVYQSQLTGIDRLAAYSTISIYLEEVLDETAVIVPTNMSGKMYESFIKSVNSTIRFFQNVLIVLAGLSVPLFVVLVALLIIWGLFRLRRSVRRNRRGKE